MTLILIKLMLMAKDLTQVYLKEVVFKHEIPEEIISNRDKLFISKFWKALLNFLKIKQKLSTAFHLQTNKENKRINQVVKAYLQYYINYQQNN